jgi:hypothetical protein
MTTPQNVSSRYVRNLISEGSNSNFELGLILQKPSRSPSGILCGFYYVAEVKRTTTSEPMSAEGATPEQAVSLALGNFGVTFK